MTRRMKVLTIGILIIALLIGGNGKAVLADIQFILPNEGNLFGANYYLGSGTVKPYVGTAYEYSLGQTLYHFGGQYTVDQTTYDLNYGYWLNYSLPGYGFKDGLEGSVNYTAATGYQLKAGVFSGEVSQDAGDGVGTSYLFVDYTRQLSFDLDQEWKLRLQVNAGTESAGDGGYSVTILETPGKIKNFKLIPRLGLLQAVGTVQPFFDLMYYLRGYDRKAQIGNKLAAVTLDQQFPLFANGEDQEWQIASLLKGSIFLDAGDVLPADQDWTALRLRYDAGVGLVMNLGSMEFRLDQVFTDEGKQKMLFVMMASI